ncbi:MAG: 3-deoxy-manno-octulosonate cytidylyltransferase [Candidatus Rokubacteria bacterium]|nr:3-deoxy-manno-octulosonate cytidylyltransferase [Candidatus Rokubacteria bacterium]
MTAAAGLAILGVIPARLQSQRLPRKVLRDIAGRALVLRVYDAAKRSPHLSDVLVATDAEEVAGVCAAHGVPCVVTSAEHPSGTDRVWEIAQHREADVYVNIQGDEPLLTPGHVERLVTPFLTEPDVQVSTLCIRATDDELPNPAVNKVVVGLDGYALYFSKYPIPYDRDGRGTVRYKHVGLYAYRKRALDTFHALPPSPLELTERLEQLRFLEHGIRIRVMETDEPTIGVDTEDDVRAVEAWLAAHPR